MSSGGRWARTRPLWASATATATENEGRRGAPGEASETISMNEEQMCPHSRFARVHLRKNLPTYILDFNPISFS